MIASNRFFHFFTRNPLSPLSQTYLQEVPLGLEIMGKCVEQGSKQFCMFVFFFTPRGTIKFSRASIIYYFVLAVLGRYPYDWKKVIFSSILRMVVGYLFLTCLFFTVIQESQVLNIFFDGRLHVSDICIRLEMMRQYFILHCLLIARVIKFLR